jgi:hypothetical protein
MRPRVQDGVHFAESADGVYTLTGRQSGKWLFRPALADRPGPCAVRLVPGGHFLRAENQGRAAAFIRDVLGMAEGTGSQS